METLTKALEGIKPVDEELISARNVEIPVTTVAVNVTDTTVDIQDSESNEAYDATPVWGLSSRCRREDDSQALSKADVNSGSCTLLGAPGELEYPGNVSTAGSRPRELPVWLK